MSVPKTLAELAERLVALERRQAMMLRRIGGDAESAAELDEGDEWAAAVEWARETPSE